MSKYALTVLSIILLVILVLNKAYASEAALLKKLVEKGILSQEEASQIAQEAKEEAKKEISQQLTAEVKEEIKKEIYQQVANESKEQIKKEVAATKFEILPDWVKNTKLKGDFRLRFQNLHEKNTSDINKNTALGRIRLRLGLDSKVNDKIKVGVGIATGSGDPRSTNVSFGATQSKKGVYLDYAYGKYDPLPWLSITGGKMLLNDVLWEPTDLIWDTDITPEGAVFGLSKKFDKASLFMNTGFLVIESDASTVSGSNGYLVQPGIKYTFNDRVSLKSALTYEYFQTKGTVASSYSLGQNTKVGTSYADNYSNINPALELSINKPFEAINLNVENLKFFSEYVNNLAVSDKSSGFSLGFQLGKEKLEKWGDWQVRYIYAMLAKDAVLDVLPDSDRYKGKTGMRSHEGVINFGLGKNTFLGLDVYRSWSLVGNKAPETLVQADWNMKF